MQVIQLPNTIEDLVFEASPARTPGLHVSEIIKSICVELDPKRFTADSDKLPWNKFESGFSFERVLEMAFMSRRDGIFRPGEIVKDGVIMSPDGIDPDGSSFSFGVNDDWILEEFKFTWMSDFDCPHHAKFWHWLVQMKAYAFALETLKARLRVLFVNGDYRDGYKPSYKVWDILFTYEELQENWAMLMGHARAKGML
jgi:hypothetical protein